ncbi:MAG: TonB-dependent receptor [Pirellulales bacterium]|nr:TonB-dependent receptor [Pirellulales bacterium]
MDGSSRVRVWGIVLALLLGMQGVSSGQSIAPAPLPSSVVPPAQAESTDKKPGDAEAAALAEMDLESLSKVRVAQPTLTDPIVEAVSKTPEKASEAPGIVDVITAQDIEEFGAKNLYEVLERATSVYMTGSYLYRRNRISMRGDLSTQIDNHVLILLNGRPIRNIISGGNNFPIYTAFPLQTIERIEVIRGPGSALYGSNAYVGVVNIVTKNPKKPTVHASELVGSYGWQSYSLAAGNGNETKGVFGGATYSRGKGWPFTATSEDPPGPAPATTDTVLYGEDNVGAFAMYRNKGFTANVFVANATETTMGSSPTWPAYWINGQNVFVDLGYYRELDDRQSVKIDFTYNYSLVVFPSAISTPGNEIPFIPVSNSFLLEGMYRAKLTPKLDVMIGGLADIHQGVTRMNGMDAGRAFNEVWYGVYMQSECRVTDWLKLVGGLQGNMPGEVCGGIVPRAGVITSLSPQWTVKFLYGQAFRSPYEVERSANVPGILVGNPNLSPELIQTFDLQVAYHTDDYRMAATFFQSDYFNMITRVGVAPQTYENIGSMKFQGVELENQWRFSKQWRWLGSVTYQNNVRNSDHNVTLTPNWMAKMGLAYNSPRGLNVGLFDTFFGKPTANPTAAVVNRVPQAYHLMSLNATLDLDRRFHWHTGRSMRLQFMIQNLLNERIDHPEFDRQLINSLPAEPGRTFYGGFAMEY